MSNNNGNGDSQLSQQSLNQVYTGNIKVSAVALSTQLILRAILLKLNSTEAHKLMKDQLHIQVDSLKNFWFNKEKGVLANVADTGECTQEEALELESKIKQSFEVLSIEAKEIIDGVFEPPSDVAGTM